MWCCGSLLFFTNLLFCQVLLSQAVSPPASLAGKAYEYRYHTGEWTVYGYQWGEVSNQQGAFISDHWTYDSTQMFSSLAFPDLTQSNFNLGAIHVELGGWFFNRDNPSDWSNAVTRYSDFTISNYNYDIRMEYARSVR